jgi:hypothetical protein
VPPQDVTVPASAATSSSQYQTFQDLGSIASRTATLKSIWPRIGEAGTFHGRLGAPTPLLDSNADEDLDSDTESLYSSSSSSSGGALSDWDRTPFVGGTANDMLMARGHLDPGVYVDFVHIPTGVEKSGADDGQLGAAVDIY